MKALRSLITGKPVWERHGAKVVPAREIHDDGHASHEAYQIVFDGHQFRHRGRRPIITLSFYPAYGPPADGTFFIGFQYTYKATICGCTILDVCLHPHWSYTGWGNTGTTYPDLSTAGMAAWDAATSTGWSTGPEPEGELAAVLAWDGQPW